MRKSDIFNHVLIRSSGGPDLGVKVYRISDQCLCIEVKNQPTEPFDRVLKHFQIYYILLVLMPTLDTIAKTFATKKFTEILSNAYCSCENLKNHH